jgi:hypothetical protein
VISTYFEIWSFVGKQLAKYCVYQTAHDFKSEQARNSSAFQSVSTLSRVPLVFPMIIKLEVYSKMPLGCIMAILTSFPIFDALMKSYMLSSQR